MWILWIDLFVAEFGLGAVAISQSLVQRNRPASASFLLNPTTPQSLSLPARRFTV